MAAKSRWDAIRLVVTMMLALAACGRSKSPATGGDAAEPADAAKPADAARHDAPVLIDAPRDSSVSLDGGNATCNVLTQTGCTNGDKCTWIIDTAGTTATPSTGHIGCTATGTAAVAAACTRTVPPDGTDNCVAGAYCFGPDGGGSGVCKQICDQNGGAPMCPGPGSGSAAGPAGLGYACATYDGLFGPAGMAVAAGVCDAVCDALADNDFLASGAKSGKGYSASTGQICSATQGCYGYPNNSGIGVSQFTCSTECAGAGSDCNLVSYSAIPLADTFLNACSEGYLPLLYADTGHTTVACIAMCAPADCYTGSCGSGTSGNLIGASPHQCSTTDARGQLVASTLGSNGVNETRCIYSWAYEIGLNGTVYTSPTSDVLGFCTDNGSADGGIGCQWDPTGGSNYNTICPKCDTLPLSGLGTAIPNCTPVTGAGSDACYTGNAGSWNCVKSTEATPPSVAPGSHPLRVIHRETGRTMHHALRARL